MLSTKTNSLRGSTDSWALRESTGPTHFLSKYSGGYANKPSFPRILMKVILFQAKQVMKAYFHQHAQYRF